MPSARPVEGRGGPVRPRLLVSAGLHIALLLALIYLLRPNQNEGGAVSPPAFDMVFEHASPAGKKDETKPSEIPEPSNASPERTPPTPSPAPTPPPPPPAPQAPPQPAPSPVPPAPPQPTAAPPQASAVPTPMQALPQPQAVPQPQAPPQPQATPKAQAAPPPPTPPSPAATPVPPSAPSLPAGPQLAMPKMAPPPPAPSAAPSLPESSLPAPSLPPAAGLVIAPPQSPPVQKQAEQKQAAAPETHVDLAPLLQEEHPFEVPAAPAMQAPAQTAPQTAPHAPRSAAAPARPRGGAPAFPAPMDLSFGNAVAQPSQLPRGVRGNGAIDFSLGRMARENMGEAPREDKAAEGMIHVRGAPIGKGWMEQLEEWWVEHRFYPEQAAANGEDGNVTIHVRVDRSGRVQLVELESSSGSQWLDLGAQAVFRNQQLPPLPPSMLEDYKDLDINIQFLLIRR
jgi:periplasmic protein TonB